MLSSKIQKIAQEDSFKIPSPKIIILFQNLQKCILIYKVQDKSLEDAWECLKCPSSGDDIGPRKISSGAQKDDFSYMFLAGIWHKLHAGSVISRLVKLSLHGIWRQNKATEGISLSKAWCRPGTSRILPRKCDLMKEALSIKYTVYLEILACVLI